jgi:hypothetical protein
MALVYVGILRRGKCSIFRRKNFSSGLQKKNASCSENLEPYVSDKVDPSGRPV